MSRNLIAEQEGINLNAMIEAIIKRSCIVDFGVVLDNSKKGIVKVAVAVANTQQDMIITTCVLANIASSAVTVNIKPEIGDKVLVLYPRLYDNEMFNVPSTEAEKKKVIVNGSAKGYNLTSGIAILLSQYKTAGHKNLIDFTDGALSLKLAYDEQSDKNLITLDINKDGEVLLENPNYSLVIDKDGYLSYTNTSDNKTKLVFTSSGMTVQDKNGCKIESSSSDIKINNKLTIKK